LWPCYRSKGLSQEAPEKERRPSLGKLKEWLLRPFLATSAWTRKLRDRLSR
jgi:hypothetical protein